MIGMNKAHVVNETATRKALLLKLFGCHLMGTFNIKLDEKIVKCRPVIRYGIHRFYLVKISVEETSGVEIYEYGWAYRWKGSKQLWAVIEVYTKRQLPDIYKQKDLRVEVLEKWDEETIDKWAKEQYWFQGFPWLKTQRSDSDKVWQFMKNEDYSNKTVLDYGCNSGYYAFKASKAGAVVLGVDTQKKPIEQAKIINDHIECQDVKFEVRDLKPEDKADFLFELSVYHWVDKKYEKLVEHIENLKNRCKILYLELISPPLEGEVSEAEVDKIVGGKKLVRYSHKIRSMRTLYKIEGYL